ncbi:hypothetical protein M0R88_05995 [Halorussus gelatinilyticus]|uniref:Uncharacterized protein n=1 Tax=Halorussus gelatinilyticus TaxID=2937524 RepID=A0A8U0IM12_9EURY|nr:hypothetical protein [Halorussus gelatinilyticus]UPW01651.1 hypothetical protein M0R88_05995 [Halorussus gelatinilyticus]
MMFWLIFKIIPIGFLVRVLAIAALVSAAVFGYMAYSASAQSADDCADALTNEEYEECIENTDSSDTADGPDDDSSNGDASTLFYHGEGIRLNSIETNDDGEAVVKVSSEDGGEQVVITDSSRQTEGEMERYRYELSKGENTLRVPLHNPETPALTVDAAGRLYFWIGEGSSINWAPDAGHSLGMTVGGGAVVLVMMTGLQLLLARGATKPKNPIK